MMKLRILCAFFVATCIINNSFGQEQKADTISQQKLDEVIVTALRIPAPLRSNPGSVSLVNSIVIQSAPRGIAVDEVLRLVPGVRIDNQANGSRIHMSIRGQGILSERGLRGIKVLIDGIPVNDPTGFAPDLYDVDWSYVSKVEVVRGPAASIYGGASNAGILNISTESGEGNKPGGLVSVSAGSNGFFKLLAQSAGSEGKMNYRLSISDFSGNGYRYHTAFRGSIFSNRITWQLTPRIRISETLIISHYFNQNAEGLNLGQLSDPRQANPDAIPCNEYQDTKRITGGLTTLFKINEHQEFNVTAYLKGTNYLEPGSSAVQHRQFITPGGSVQYNLHTTSGSIRQSLSAGTDFQTQDIAEYKVPNKKDPLRAESIGSISMRINEGNELLANQDINQYSWGLFAIEKLEFGKHFSMLFSLRYDNIHNKLTDKMDTPEPLSGSAGFAKVSGRAGLAYEFSRAFTLYTNIGQGFLPPSTEELTNNPGAFGGFNQGLKPATSLGEEAGLRGYIRDYLVYDITLFHLDTKNDFYRYRISSRPLETFYGNAGASSRNGIETSVTWKPLKDLSFQAAYTYSDFRYTSPDSIMGNKLPNSPAHQLYAESDYTFVRHLKLSLAYEMQGSWTIYTNAIQSGITQDGFSLFHARVEYVFNIGPAKGSVSVYCKNIGNKQYIAFTEPDPDGNSYQPSARRELFLSLKLML